MIDNSQTHTDNSQGKIEADNNSGTIIGNVSGNYVGGNQITYGPVTGNGNAIGAGASVSITQGDNSHAFGTNSVDPQEQDLDSLLQMLLIELKNAPLGNKDEAEEIAGYAEEYVAEMKSEKRRKVKLKITKEGLLVAAQNFATVLPAVVGIAQKMVQGA